MTHWNKEISSAIRRIFFWKFGAKTGEMISKTMKKRLLIIKPSSLGDIVQALQVVSSAKIQRPDMEVTWVVRDMFAPVIDLHGAVDSTIPFHRKAGIGGFLTLLKEIRGRGIFDAVWDMQGLFRSGLMTFAARGLKKFGRRDFRELAGLFYDRKVEMPENKPGHAVEILAEFLPTIGLEKKVHPLKFNFELADRLDLPSPYILIFPESRGEKKEWPFFDFLTAKLCRRQENLCVAWCGFRDDPAPLSSQWPNFVDLRGKTSLPQIIDLIRRANGVIGNDSGCIHLSAALQRPTLAIFRCTDPKRFGPYSLPGSKNFTLESPPRDFPEIESFLGCCQNLA